MSIGLTRCCKTTVFTRRRSCSFAEYWKHFVARFNDVHAFGYNSAGSGGIWMKLGALRVYCRELAPADFGRDPRRSESGSARQIFVFFCPVNNARLHRFPISQILRNFQTRRGSMSAWILLENIFENLPVRVFSENFKFCLNVVNDFRLQAAISLKWIQILESHDSMTHLWNVGFSSVPLKPTQSHCPGLQSAHMKCTFECHVTPDLHT